MQKDIPGASGTTTNNNCPNGAQAATAPFRAGQNWRRGKWRGGRSIHCGQRNQPVYFGPFAQFSTPPPAVFDIPPRVLPVNMFNANVVPPSERDAQFDAQFAPFMNHFPTYQFNSHSPCFHETAPPLSLNDSDIVHPSSSLSSAHSHHSVRGGKTHRRKVGREDKKSRRNYQKLPSEQLSQLSLESEMSDLQEGYGCPPSYVMESYRDQTELTTAAQACQTSKDDCNSKMPIYVNGIFQNYKEVIYRENDSLQTLRDRLEKQLEEESYECMICCQVIRANEWIWTCKKCHHMFHINRSNSYGCITQWAAKSFNSDVGWRCPSCQNVTFELPKQYRCFCTKKLNPPTQRFPDMPHSCNGICGKIRGSGCTHPCTDQCHPGPCSECPLTITKKCNCGRQIIAGRCGKQVDFKCSMVCGKTLNCGLHKCETICHKGECNACEHVVIQKCFCGFEERIVPCTALNLKFTSFSCGAPCTGMYACGIHKCELRCHDKHGRDDCGPCSLSPEKKEHCPCGRTLIAELQTVTRTSCTDPVPTCKNVCGKVLACGPEDKPHRCMQLCHVGSCPGCPSSSLISCRCKALKKIIPCKEFLLYSTENPYLCVRRCKKLKTCQNHRCRAVCCVDEEHVCMQICGKKLNCGIHNCDRLCHVGQCPRCLQASFEEQYCLCGKTVREPPIPCGTSLPLCDQPCSRQHPCDHPPMHNCHAEPECPPCTVLTEKPCYGAHEIRANIPCFLSDVSCGCPCDRKLSCNVHRCKRICHAGECLVNNASCQQPCSKRRVGEACDHICGLPCHGDTPCPKTKVVITCSCLRKSSEMRCSDVEKAYQKSLSLKVMEDNYSNISAEKRLLKRNLNEDNLPCDVECQRILRNKKVAETLNISRPDATDAISAYTTFLKNKLKTNYEEILHIEHTLIELVHNLDVQPNVTSVNHSFPPMSSELRRIIHEYSGYFGIETISHGQEPRRNVVATAKRSSSVAIAPCKTLPSVRKSVLSAENRMQQLQSVGKVLKRGVKEASASQK
uniref:R3H domain-containing protein n=1 Tax=Elaeophora elaphi TaxID=1147741 RepID=A0A158Q728_9BILA